MFVFGRMQDVINIIKNIIFAVGVIGVMGLKILPNGIVVLNVSAFQVSCVLLASLPVS